MSMVQMLEDVRAAEWGGLGALEWLGVIGICSWILWGLIHWLTYKPGGIRRALALAKARKRHPVTRTVTRRITIPRGDEHVLVVDDEKQVRDAIARMLSGLGYAVECAANGPQALDFVREQETDLVLLDMVMPGMDGEETFRRIKELRPQQKAVMVTGWAKPSQVQAMHSLGVEQYLIKPVPLLTLARAIRDEIEASPVAA